MAVDNIATQTAEFSKAITVKQKRTAKRGKNNIT
jgi:hypothetical protein